MTKLYFRLLFSFVENRQNGESPWQPLHFLPATICALSNVLVLCNFILQIGTMGEYLPIHLRLSFIFGCSFFSAGIFPHWTGLLLWFGWFRHNVYSMAFTAGQNQAMEGNIFQWHWSTFILLYDASFFSYLNVFAFRKLFLLLLLFEAYNRRKLCCWKSIKEMEDKIICNQIWFAYKWMPILC